MVASYVDIGNSLDSFVGPLEGYNTAGKMQRSESMISLSAVSATAAGCAFAVLRSTAQRLPSLTRYPGPRCGPDPTPSNRGPESYVRQS